MVSNDLCSLLQAFSHGFNTIESCSGLPKAIQFPASYLTCSFLQILRSEINPSPIVKDNFHHTRDLNFYYFLKPFFLLFYFPCFKSQKEGGNFQPETVDKLIFFINSNKFYKRNVTLLKRAHETN